MPRQSRPGRQTLLLLLATIIALSFGGIAHARSPGPNPRGEAGAEIGERSEGTGQMKGQMLAETSTLLQSGATAQMQAAAMEQQAKVDQAQGQMAGAMAGQAATSAAGTAALGASLRASAAAVAGDMSAMVSSTRAQ